MVLRLTSLLDEAVCVCVFVDLAVLGQEWGRPSTARSTNDSFGLWLAPMMG